MMVFSLVFITCMSLSSVMADSETQQWQCFSSVIQTQEQEFATLGNKVGSCLNDNAVFFSMPVGALAALQGALISRAYPVLSNNGQTNFFVGGLIGGTAGSLVAYSICKSIGKLLQNRPALCKQILIAYIAEWQINKPNTPEVFHPMFDAMHAEFMNDATISSISEQQASQIVEGLLAASVVFAAGN